MRRDYLLLVAAALAALLGIATALQLPEQPPPPEPVPIPEPIPPAPPPAPCPPNRPCPREGEGGAVIGGRVGPHGRPLDCDLPESQHLHNKGGRDGAGLCVFTSAEHAARWHSVGALIGFRDWMTKQPGGGYPEKLSRMIAAKCSEAGQPVPPYVQAESADYDLVRRACGAGHLVCSTYYHSPTGRYGGRKVYHMVNIAHADEAMFAVLDNNYPGADRYEWIPAGRFLSVCSDGGRAWVVVFLNPGPPPPPRN